MYVSPRLRVQGSCEVSNGGAPSQSAAVAEPLLALLHQYESVLSSLKSTVDLLVALDQDVTNKAIAEAAGELATVTTLTARIVEKRAQLGASSIPTPSAPNDGIINSQLIKIER